MSVLNVFRIVPQDGGTTGAVVKRIMEQEEALCNVLSADRKTIHLIPIWQDTDVL